MRFCFALAAVALFTVNLVPAQCNAQDVFWTGAEDGTSWNAGGNWDTGTAPGIGQLGLFGELFSPPFGPPLDVQVNQATQTGGFIAFDTLNLELNADFTASGSTGFGGGGSLNIKNHTFTGSLAFGETEGFFGPLESPFSLTRDGGVLNLTAISLVGGSGVSPTVFDLAETDAVISEGAGTVAENSVFNINGASVNWAGDIDGGTVNLNAGTISGGTTVNFGGTLNINGGTLSGDLGLGTLVGATPTITRSGGTLDLDNLALLNGGQLTIGATDNITESINVAETSELTVDRSLNLTGNLRVAADSKVFLNGNLVAQQLIYDGDSFVRANGVSVDVDLLEFRNAEYTYDGADGFARAIRIDNGQLNINQTASSQSGFVDASNNSTVNVNAETSVGSGGLTVGGGSTLNLNAGTSARVIAAGLSVVNVNADINSGPAFRVLGSTLNLNEGTLRGALELFEENGISSTFNRSLGSSLVLSSLEIRGDTHLDFVDGDSFIPGSGRVFLSDGASVDVLNSSLVIAGGSVDLSSNSRMRILQSAGQLDGLVLSLGSSLGIDGTSNLELVFDEILALEGELDFGLRLNFDQTDLLQGYLDSGLITVSGADTADIGVIRDRDLFGDFTYVGYVGNASSVPEPSGSLILMLSLALCSRRCRRASM